jgi:hypothetical protein
MSFLSPAGCQPSLRSSSVQYAKSNRLAGKVILRLLTDVKCKKDDLSCKLSVDLINKTAAKIVESSNHIIGKE